MKKLLITKTIYAITFLLTSIHASETTVTEINHKGFTWKFESPVTAGQFINDDWWVIAPVTIVSIEPFDNVDDGTDMHGSIINPIPWDDGALQGIDSRCKRSPYDSSKNVAKQLPITVTEPSSLISFESHEERHDPQLKKAEVLTILNQIPLAGAFRPTYAGSDKSVQYNVSQLNTDIFHNRPKPRSAPSIDKIKSIYEGIFFDIIWEHMGSSLKTTEYAKHYGRDVSNQIAETILLLNTAISEKDKRDITIGFVQRGIDLHGAYKAGMKWPANGGHMQGRKPVILITGVVLGDDEMVKTCDGIENPIFQEDEQHFYVSQEEIDTPRISSLGRPNDPYSQEMLGLPEWGADPVQKPGTPGSNWGVYYRNVCGHPNTGIALSMIIMKLEDEWNQPAFFDYIVTRYWPITIAKEYNGKLSNFYQDMWNSYGPDMSRESPSSPTNLTINSE